MPIDQLAPSRARLTRIASAVAVPHAWTILWIAVVSALGLGGCRQEEIAEGATIRDSAGVRIVENGQPAFSPAAGAVATPPVLVIPGEAEGSSQLSDVVGVALRPDGQIVVASAGARAVLFFGADRRLLQTIGRPGHGPGEFTSVYGIYPYRGDSLAVFDTHLQRLTIFSGDGEYGRSFSPVWPTGGTRVVPAGSIGDGQWLMMFGTRAALEQGNGPYRLPFHLARYDDHGDMLGTLVNVPGFEVVVHSAEGGRAAPARVFGRGVAVMVEPHRFWVASNDSYELRGFDLAGQLRWIVRRTPVPRPVTAADLDAGRSAQLDLIRDPMQKSLIAEAFDQVPAPRTMPAFGRAAFERAPWMLADPKGGFWVVNYRGPLDVTEVWSRFDPEGRFLGEVALPPGFELSAIGSGVLVGRTVDPLGVESILLYRFTRAESEP